MEINIDKRHQTHVVLWCALLMNVAVLFLVTFIVEPDVSNETSGRSAFLITFALTALGVFLVVISFAVERKLLQRSVDLQDINLVQKGFVVAWAICEVSALMGLFERLLLGNRNYLLFLFAVIGIALHFPRREHLVSASYKTLSSGGAGS